MASQMHLVTTHKLPLDPNMTNTNLTGQPGPDYDGQVTTNPRLVNGVVVLLLMLFNIGGNSLVFYVYHFLTKSSVFSLFVRVLAALDLLTAVTTMLIDVIMKVRPNDETELNLKVMCKLSHFQVYANSLTSGCVLTLIAYQRYRKICHPLKRSITMRKAKYLLFGMCLCSLIVSVPTIIVYGPMDIAVLVAKKKVKCIICRYDEDYKGSILQQITSYFLLLAFSVVLLATIVLYVMVSRAILKFERRNSMASPASPTTNTVEIATVNAQWDVVPVVSPVNGRPVTSPVHGRPVTSPVHGRPVKTAKHETPPAPAAADRASKANNANRLSNARASIFSVATGNVVSAQMYRVFAVITVVFIVSYLPHLVVLILTKVLDLDHTVLAQGERIMLEFAYNCPYISTVANPLVYGFSSSEFRDHLRELFYCDYACCRRSETHSRHLVKR